MEPPTHQSPELIKSGKLTKPADVFSFGILMWEVANRMQPWVGMTTADIITLVAVEDGRPEFNTDLVPQDYVSLAESCWATDPAQRPAFEQLVTLLQQLLPKAGALQLEVDAGWEQLNGYL